MSFSENLIRYLCSVVKIIIGILAVQIFLRSIELLYKVYLVPLNNNSLSPELFGYISDFASVSRVFFLLFAVGLVFIWNKLALKIILLMISNIYILIALSAVGFFIISFVPLDHALFTYSFTEIIEIIKSSQLGISHALIIVISFALFYFIAIKVKITPLISYIVLILCGIGAFGLYPLMNNYINNQTSQIDKDILLNKADYFIYKSYSNLSNLKKDKNVCSNENLKSFLNHRNEDGFYKKACEVHHKSNYQHKYPLIHTNTFNPLKEFFNDINNKPNIVLIIVESLGYNFFDRTKLPICLTPFLDSLKNES